MVVAVPPLELAWEVGGYLPAGVYAAFTIAVAIGAPILFVIAAFGVLLFGHDRER
jgi:hypothetical protein